MIDAVLNCYRLAKVYGRNPNEFLAMPVSEVEVHIDWTDRMFEAGETQQTLMRRRNG